MRTLAATPPNALLTRALAHIVKHLFEIIYPSVYRGYELCIYNNIKVYDTVESVTGSGPNLQVEMMEFFRERKKNTKQQPLSVGALMVVGRYMLWFLLYTTKSELML